MSRDTSGALEPSSEIREGDSGGTIYDPTYDFIEKFIKREIGIIIITEIS
jgi:hypothetical protein